MMIDNGSNLFSGNERYEIVRRIGFGATGVVYEGFDRYENVRVAIKVLSRSDQLARFRREFSEHQHLQHPNLCSFGDFYIEEGAVFFTMELVEGLDFLTYVRTSNQASSLGFDEARLRACLKQVGTGLSVLHQAGKVHRDIKPSNILIDREGRAVIMDFGISTEVIFGRQLGDQEEIGTLEYMSPEQGIGESVGTATDWYSVGVMLYQAMTGTLPFSGTEKDIKTSKLVREPDPPSVLVTGIPEDLDLICQDLLRVDPKNRLRDTRALKRLGVEAPALYSNVPGASTALFDQETLFVGREQELSWLDEAFKSIGSKQGKCVIVKAQAGLGKTMMVRKFLERLQQEQPEKSNPLILTSRCYQAVSVPFQAAARLADDLSKCISQLPLEGNDLLAPQDASALTLLFPRLTLVFERFDKRTEWGTNPRVVRVRAFNAFAELLRAVAELRPVVLFLDDLQWIDSDSLALLRVVFNETNMPPVLFIATIREEDYCDKNVEGLANRQEISLGGLKDEDAHELADLLYRHYGAPWDGDVESIASEAQGHPLFLTELVRYDVMSAKGRARASLEEVIYARIQELDDVQRQLLELLSVAGRPVEEELLMDAAGLQLKECVQALASLHIAHLIRSSGTDMAQKIELFHDRVRETVLATMPQNVLTKHHNTMARVLVGRLGHASDLVHHLQSAGQRQSAAEQAEIAVKRARQALAFDQVVKFLRIALELGQHSKERRWQLHMELGDALCNAGLTREASEVYLAATDNADPVGRLKSYNRAITQLILAGHLDAGVEQIRKVLEEIGEQSMPSTPQRAVASVLWGRLRLKLRGLGWKPCSVSDVSPRKLARLDVLKGVAMGISLCDNIQGAEFNTRFLLAALETGAVERLQVALALEAIFVATGGGKATDRAGELARKVKRIAEQYPENEYGAIWALSAEAIVAYFQGRFAVACPIIEEVCRGFRTNKKASAIDFNNARAFQLYCLRYLGRFRVLRISLDDTLREARERGDQYIVTMLTRYVGRFGRLVRDEPDLALSDLDQNTWATPPGAYHLQNWYDLEARGEIALYKGEGPSALEELQESFNGLSRSMLLRVQPVRVLSRSLRARLLVSTASFSRSGRDSLKKAASLAKQILIEDVGYSKVLGSLILAAVTNLQYGSNQDKTAYHLNTALIHARKDELNLHAAVAGRLLGQLKGGDEGAQLLQESDTWMESEGILRPDCLVEMIAPGVNSS